MNNEHNLINAEQFTAENSKSVEAISESIYKQALSSILSDNVDTLESAFKDTSKNFEKISNRLQLDNAKHFVCYHFGKISAIINIIIELSGKQRQEKELDNIPKSYSLLIPALQAIKKHNTVSAAQLQVELNLKSGSSVSNFLKRIYKYNLINTQKIGTRNYLSLTKQGETLLSKNQNTALSEVKGSQISVSELYHVIDCISDSIKELNTSSINVMHRCELNHLNLYEKRLLKQKFDYILCAREDYVKAKITNSTPAFANDITIFFYDDHKPAENEYVYEKYDNIYSSNNFSY